MIRRIAALFLVISFLFQQAGFAQVAGEINLSGYFNRMASSFAVDKFRPVHLRYFSYNNLTNNFKLLLDKGDVKQIQGPELEESTKALLSYFLVGVSLPNDSFWVNLRPDREDQIIDDELGKTDVGKIMLEADLCLKKDTAKFTSPDTAEGREYWDKLYKKAEELFGNENVTIPTLTRPWIVPNEIIVRETDDSAYIYKATMKVLLEQDHLKDSAVYKFDDERLKELNEYSSQLIRELIMPKLTKEVNTAKRYSSLRQVFYSLVLSRWFKGKFNGKEGTYASLIDTSKLEGLTSKENWTKTTYFKEYQRSFQEGEYNIKEPVYTPSGQVIRSYFSGGNDFTLLTKNGWDSPVQTSAVGGALKSGNGEVFVGTTKDTQLIPERITITSQEISSPTQEEINAASPIVNQIVKESISRLRSFVTTGKNHSMIKLAFQRTLIGYISNANEPGNIGNRPMRNPELLEQLQQKEITREDFLKGLASELLAAIASDIATDLALEDMHEDGLDLGSSEIRNLRQFNFAVMQRIIDSGQIGIQQNPANIIPSAGVYIGSKQDQIAGFDSGTGMFVLALSPSIAQNILKFYLEEMEKVASEQQQEGAASPVEGQFNKLHKNMLIAVVLAMQGHTDEAFRVMISPLGPEAQGFRFDVHMVRQYLDYKKSNPEGLEDAWYSLYRRVKYAPQLSPNIDFTNVAFAWDYLKNNQGLLEKFASAGRKTNVLKSVYLTGGKGIEIDYKGPVKVILAPGVEFLIYKRTDIPDNFPVKRQVSRSCDFVMIRTDGALDGLMGIWEHNVKILGRWMPGHNFANRFGEYLDNPFVSARHIRVTRRGSTIIIADGIEGRPSTNGLTVEWYEERSVTDASNGNRDLALQEVENIKAAINQGQLPNGFSRKNLILLNGKIADTYLEDIQSLLLNNVTPATQVDELKKELEEIKKEVETILGFFKRFGFGSFRERLGVNSNADKKEIQAAYRQLMQEFFPDRYGNGDDPHPISKMVAQEFTKLINEAYAQVNAQLRNGGAASPIVEDSNAAASPIVKSQILTWGEYGDFFAQFKIEILDFYSRGKEDRVKVLMSVTPHTNEHNTLTVTCRFTREKFDELISNLNKAIEIHLGGTLKELGKAFFLSYFRDAFEQPRLVAAATSPILTHPGPVPGTELYELRKIFEQHGAKDEDVAQLLTDYERKHEGEKIFMSLSNGITEFDLGYGERKSGASPVLEDAANPGGIDFRVMDIVTQPIGNFTGLNFNLPILSSAELSSIDLDTEMQQIKNMVQQGMIPSGQRMKEFVAACSQKGELNSRMDDLIICLLDICRLEEENVSDSTQELKEVLVILDSKKIVALNQG